MARRARASAPAIASPLGRALAFAPAFAFASALAFLFAGAGCKPAPPSSRLVAIDAQSIQLVRDRFNASSKLVRVLALLSPS
jgi:hypothetical protein